MPERSQVFACIDNACEHFDDARKHVIACESLEFTPLFQLKTEDYLALINGLNQILLHNERTEHRLEMFGTLAGLCMLAMEANGGCSRVVLTGEPGPFLEPKLNRRKVQALVESEIDYLDSIRDQKSLTVAGAVILAQNMIQQANVDWGDMATDEYALNRLRELAGALARCMEHNDIIFKGPFEA